MLAGALANSEQVSTSTEPIEVQLGASNTRDSHPRNSGVSASEEPRESGCAPRHIHVAHVRYQPGDDHLRLQLRICNDRKTFFRSVSEKLTKLRHRLQILAAQAVEGAEQPLLGNRTRKQRNRTDRFHCQSSAIAVQFLTKDGTEIAAKSTAVGEALPRTERIIIGESVYAVVLNQPTVGGISVLDPILADVPVTPVPETDFCSPDDCSWRWYRVDAAGNDALVAETRRYLPTEQDIGCRLRIECHAPAISVRSHATHDSATQVVTTPVVIRGPDRAVFEPRRRLGSKRATVDPTAFRVMTYNVLFDGYTDTMEVKREMFPYAPPEVLHEMYRMQLVFQEIAEANADIVCLQEMGQRTFHSFFEPILEPLGYHTLYTGKTGSTQEGCTVLVRSDCFEVVGERMLALSQEAIRLEDPAVRELLVTYPELAKGLRRIPSVAQLITLRDCRDASKHLVLANTHLYYREDADMIRVVQAVAVVRAIERLKQSLEAQGGRVAVLFCGDLNAVPDSAATAFLLGGGVDATHRHWQEIRDFQWKRGVGSGTIDKRPIAETVRPARIVHSLALTSACGIPEFTNFAGSFVATLDYILLGSRELNVQQTFPLFSRDQVSAEVALPSTVFPSDHISLVADLQWKH